MKRPAKPVMDLIRIQGLELDCIVGIRPLEREREQRVRIDLALGLDTRAAGRNGRIALTCDYDVIAEQVIAMLRFRRYHLIEMATEELAAMLLGLHDAVQSVEIHLEKPAALDGRARAASVEIERDRGDFPTRAISAAPPTTLLLETREAGLYRLEIPPRGALGSSALRGERELDWVVSGEVFDPNGRALSGAAIREAGAPRADLHAGNAGAVLFRCVSPPVEA